MFLFESKRKNLQMDELVTKINYFTTLFITTMLALIFVPMIQAATFTVDSTADTTLTACTVALNDCTLRGAISAANTAGGTNNINFDVTVFASAQTINLSANDLFINNGTLTINGTGANLLTISGSNTVRIFTVDTGVIATITDFTLSNGNGNGALSPGFGGGIYNRGNLTLNRVAVDSNQTFAGSNGGGIFNENGGTLAIQNSTVSNNIGDIGAGGIFNFITSALTVTNSTISGNTATSGGGGGITNLGNATVTSCTIAGNTAPTSAGGGVAQSLIGGSIFTSRNSIYGDNSDDGTAPDFQGTLTSNDFNLIENITGTIISLYESKGMLNFAANDITGIDPMLDPVLTLNGGTTKTHGLLTGSPAIDKGNDFGSTIDQRGLTRPVDISTVMNGAGGASDIGAFEVQSPTAASVLVSGRVLSRNGAGVPQAIVHFTAQSGEVRSVRTNSFGYYRFSDVEVGQSIIVNVFSKRYQFSPLVISVNESISGLDFVAQ
jgi:CSLREA domain-containing protein